MIKITVISLTVLLFSSTGLFAQDRIFTYVYQSLVLNKGEKELEVWTTYRTGRDYYYRRLDARTEFEVGLGRKIQTSFYLNLTSQSSEIVDDTIPSIESETEFSFSNEWKIKLSDPVANVLGSGLYAELTIGTTELELEAKVILDKKIGRVTQALNLVFEPEWKWKPGNNEIKPVMEYKFEFNYGIGISLGKGFTIGAEIRNPNLYENKSWANSALYAGPTLSWARHDFWINVTFMPQITGLRGMSPDRNLNLNEYERYQARVIFSYLL